MPLLAGATRDEIALFRVLPGPKILRTERDAVLALINTPDPERACRDAFGERVLTVPYRRPGFLLSKEVGAAVQARPDALGLILLNHGAVTWGATAEEAYQRHLELVAMAKAHVDARMTAPVFVSQPRYKLGDDARRRVAAPRARSCASSRCGWTRTRRRCCSCCSTGTRAWAR